MLKQEQLQLKLIKAHKYNFRWEIIICCLYPLKGILLLCEKSKVDVVKLHISNNKEFMPLAWYVYFLKQQNTISSLVY